VWTLRHYVLLAPGILTWLGEFWEICAPLVWASENIVQLTVNDRKRVLLWCGMEAIYIYIYIFFLPFYVMESGGV